VSLIVYGTLTDGDRVDGLLAEWSFGPDAVLEGLHRIEGRYPTLAPGGRVTGRILHTPEVDELDRYEGVESGLYVRVPVPVEGAGGEPGTVGDGVHVYVGDPDRLGVGADVEWPGAGSFEERVRTYIRDRDVVVRVENSGEDGAG